MLQESQNETGGQSEPLSAEDVVVVEPASVERGAVEVLPFENEGMEETMTLQANQKKSWLPWKRPNRRDQQLRHLREGYIELLGLVRSISGHLERQKDEESQVSTLVESLPPALNSFEKLASSQKEVTAILGNLNTHMEKTHEKDEQLLENLSGFNSTLQDVSMSHEKSLGTLGKVSERIEHSDEQMKMLFEQAHQSNEAAGSLMIRLEKRVFLSNMALVALLSMILLVAMVWLVQKQESAPTTVMINPPAPVASVGYQQPVTRAVEPREVLQETVIGQEVEQEPSQPSQSEAAVEKTSFEPVSATLVPINQDAAEDLEMNHEQARGEALEEKIEELDLFEYSYVNDWNSYPIQESAPEAE